MPIVVRDYTWEETEKTLFISVPLKGVKPGKVDVFSTEEYIKVSYPPYIFECFLFGGVHDQKSSVQIGNGTVVFKLEKQESGVWQQLQYSGITEDKEQQKELREKAHERHRVRAEEDKVAKSEAKRQLDKFGVKEQMRIEDEDRKRIEDVKQSEITKATEELEKWKDQQKALSQQVEAEKIVKQRKEKERQKTEKRGKRSNIFHEEAGDNKVREAGKIAVSFTERHFPTPLRESVVNDEEDWLKKQAEARQIKELQDSDLSEEERNPVWLRDKGNEFFKAGNYQAAINVYSHAMRMNFKMPALYSNRAACHLKIGNYIKACEDAGRALELLNPPVQQNAESRVRGHIRRGTAYCLLELYAEGLMDYEAALKIDPGNAKLIADCQRIRETIEGPKPT